MSPHNMLILAVFSLVYLLGLVILPFVLRHSPEGFEDNKGYHSGRGGSDFRKAAFTLHMQNTYAMLMECRFPC
jgi:hypothetical protein